MTERDNSAGERNQQRERNGSSEDEGKQRKRSAARGGEGGEGRGGGREEGEGGLTASDPLLVLDPYCVWYIAGCICC